ncbi:MAG: 23S rRNA (pseudouridine(1915)-N(3))-methyltransferase RlmH [Succinivibrio sp.]|jgi:23S rRNA (pseudouridine1915-N3)-methyltransferase|uniref:Ribosomal RNA large subunit methyltransferase H n=1 Tax=Succinivibrio dextrinosolvens DSM 3072 TaxID=1123324 RepID=A0A1T4V089_9GAMM|nr:23S rRNA (pseudouridine(1915)-N(3))-methyltransferase RlmH [Succinivibrio dextrinosolvens]MBE6422240.1 23S rRNA (pseudouridine(1915)-N(3))-methyltransferase RlmH [Succinivibrio dextrinosolvens]MBP5243349.1 23S rRNA (pseudouridine(1915)-N(3))-methyltransferase RlmH [Succinivibrio sp.]SKA58379.1 23S rRNA (pseudouridine1915-N3)-methyltransferase [Succinivibrio dextrinosolvens DSM 3072]
MKLIIIAVGNKMPSWVTEAFTDYQKRFPPEMKLVLEEIAPVKRNGKNSDEKAKELEAKMILEALPKKAYIVALDERGKQFTSLELGDKVGVWQNLGMDVVLIIGGPNGLTDEVRNKANELWSLSKLTLPHPLVRVFLAETIYRGWSIYANLPYHRA